MTDTPSLPALPATFRPVRTRVVLLTVGVLLFATISVVAMILPMAAGERAGFVGMGLMFLGVLALLSRPRVTADSGGVTVVNLTRTRRLAWPEILGVNLRPGDPWVFLDLADGTSLPAMGIQPGIAKQQAVADAHALRALVERHSDGS